MRNLGSRTSFQKGDKVIFRSHLKIRYPNEYTIKELKYNRNPDFGMHPQRVFLKELDGWWHGSNFDEIWIKIRQNNEELLKLDE